MSRQAMLLAGLGAVLVVIAFWFLLYQPKNEELEGVRTETESIEAQQDDVRDRIEELREIRERAAELEALLAAGESVIPRELGLPALLRHMQQAADDSGVTLATVAPGRPAAAAEEEAGEDDAEGAPADLSQLSLSVQLDGTYFQIVDFLRRVEDPEIIPRGIAWSSVSLAEGEDGFPDLSASLSGEMFALVPAGGDEAPEPEEEETEDPDDEEAEDADADADDDAADEATEEDEG